MDASPLPHPPGERHPLTVRLAHRCAAQNAGRIIPSTNNFCAKRENALAKHRAKCKAAPPDSRLLWQVRRSAYLWRGRSRARWPRLGPRWRRYRGNERGIVARLLGRIVDCLVDLLQVPGIEVAEQGCENSDRVDCMEAGVVADKKNFLARRILHLNLDFSSTISIQNRPSCRRRRSIRLR